MLADLEAIAANGSPEQPCVFRLHSSGGGRFTRTVFDRTTDKVMTSRIVYQVHESNWTRRSQKGLQELRHLLCLQPEGSLAGRMSVLAPHCGELFSFRVTV